MWLRIACHAAKYIERVPNRNYPPAVLLWESWRENGKVKKRTVANLSGLPDELVEALRAALKGESIPASEGILSPKKAIAIHDSRQHGHVATILFVLKKSGLLGMIDSKRSRERDVVAAMIIDRMIRKKDQTHRTPDGQYPIRDILKTLSAITRSRVIVKDHKKGDFKTTSTPTPYQQKILERLGVLRGM